MISIKIHENIKLIRIEKNISQKDLAKKLDIPYQTYNNYERGSRTPSPETLLKIAQGLDVSISKIFGEIIYESKNDVV